MTGSNTSIRTKTRHPADFFTYVAIYVCAILSVALYPNFMPLESP